jgi:hypothetical protein
MRAHLAYWLVALLVVAGSGRAAAQGVTIDWSPATNLSNTPTSSNRPTIAADPAGNVHVVWGEEIGGESILGIPGQLILDANALVYRRWDGSTWSDPTDIIAVRGDDVADYPSLAADSYGYLHLVWTGISTIYYSRALASQAGSPHAWTTPRIVGGSARTSWESAITVDAQGDVHILYADGGDNPAVRHVRIEDNGLGKMTWTSLSAPLVTPEAGFLNVSLRIDPKGRMHALWGSVARDGYGYAIYYARSVDAGQTWSSPVQLARGKVGEEYAQYPSLGIAGDSELHLIYAYPFNMARIERISRDAGETWGEPHTIYPDLEGIGGFNFQFSDPAGNPHAVSNMRTHDQASGLIYWRWLGDRWSPWQFASDETGDKALGGHFPAATIRLGNEIHAVWNTNFSSQAGEVWHVSGTIPGAPAQTPAPLPVAEVTPQTPQPSEQPSPGAQAAQPTVVASGSMSAVSGSTEGPSAPKGRTSTPDTASALLVSLAAPLLLVLGVVVWRLARLR